MNVSSHGIDNTIVFKCKFRSVINFFLSLNCGSNSEDKISKTRVYSNFDIMKISYIAASNLQSKAANAVHVVSMVEAYRASGVDIKAMVLVSNSPDIQGFNKTNEGSSLFNNILFSIWSTYKSRNADLIHTRSWMVAFFCSYIRVPTILELHDFEAKRNVIIRKVFHRIYKSINIIGIIYITKALKKDYNYLSKKFDVNRKYMVRPDGANFPKEMHNFSSSLIDNRKYNIGYAGHLYPGKGVEVLLGLAGHLKDDEHIHVIGGMKEDITFWTKKFNENNVSDKITFHGYYQHTYVHSFLEQMNVLLLPIQSRVTVYGGGGNIARYTSPLKMFEYMTSGTPIVASKLPVLQEILTHNVNSILVKYDNIQDWYKAIEKLRVDVSLSEFISKTAKEEMNQKYTWEIRVKNILSELNI